MWLSESVNGLKSVYNGMFGCGGECMYSCTFDLYHTLFYVVITVPALYIKLMRSISSRVRTNACDQINHDLHVAHELMSSCTEGS